MGGLFFAHPAAVVGNGHAQCIRRLIDLHGDGNDLRPGAHRILRPSRMFSAISGIMALVELLENLRHLVRRQAAVDPSLTIRTGARPHAPMQRQASSENVAVGGAFAAVNVQFFLEALIDISGALDIARSAQAN